MATNNIKIFDETKSNMLSNEAYGVNSQRLNGVQQGIASSQLQNKTLYQVSLVAYAIGQMMQANGFDANDELAVSAFCDNMSKSIMQKALDLVSVDDVTKFEDTKKYINPATWKAAFDFMKADSALIQSGTDDTHYVTPKGVGEAGTKFVSQWLSNNYFYQEITPTTSTQTKTYKIKPAIEIHACIINICSHGSNSGWQYPTHTAMMQAGESIFMNYDNATYMLEASLSDYSIVNGATLTVKLYGFDGLGRSKYKVSIFVI